MAKRGTQRKIRSLLEAKGRKTKVSVDDLEDASSEFYEYAELLGTLDGLSDLVPSQLDDIEEANFDAFNEAISIVNDNRTLIDNFSSEASKDLLKTAKDADKKLAKFEKALEVAQEMAAELEEDADILKEAFEEISGDFETEADELENEDEDRHLATTWSR